MSGDVQSVSSVSHLGDSEDSNSGASSSGNSCSSSTSASSASSDVVPGPLLLGLVLAVIPGQDSVLSGSPSVWGQTPSSELDVLSGSGDGLASGSSSSVDFVSV